MVILHTWILYSANALVREEKKEQSKETEVVIEGSIILVLII